MTPSEWIDLLDDARLTQRYLVAKLKHSQDTKAGAVMRINVMQMEQLLSRVVSAITEQVG